MTRPEAGQRFAHFHVYGVLGRGGMGVVFSAFNAREQRAVALKLLPADRSGDSRARDWFRREVELAMRLRSPHAIPVLDAGEHDGELWLEMPLLPGEDLAALLQRERRLAPRIALAICGDVAQALDAAHAIHLVHRDVKPANVRLVPDLMGGASRAYLGDFGVTRSNAPGDAGLTDRFEIVGTSHYMSPEQVMHQPVDGRTDVYSLACLLFRCLAGEPPFPGDDAAAVRNAHVAEPAPSLLGRALPVGPHLAAAVQRGMAKRPQHRPGSAGALLTECRDAHHRDAATPRFPP